MNTKNIFKAVALAMLMPAMLLTTACSNQDDVANTSNITNKGYALPVTVNATRGDGATRASFDGSKLNFSAGDKLFVKGNHETAGKFAGTLDYDAGSGKFSGTIYTKNLYEGTAEELLSAASSVFAILLPAGYNNYDFLTLNTNNGYDATISTDLSKTFALTKAAAVEQFSSEMTYSYSNGFILSPWYGILNFTITGLTPNTDVYVTFSDYTPNGNTMGGIVHTDGSGNATFAVAVYAASSKNIRTCTLYVNGNPITLVSTSKPINAGKIYNITRSIVDLSKKDANYTASNGETLTGTLEANVKISIADGATVILHNVNINGSGTWTSGNYAGITCVGDATIILSGTNTVKGFYEEYPGIQAAAGKTLTIKGSGSLTASSNGWGAGIGGGWDINCGNIEIQGGTITATGGTGSAGIGAGNGGYSGVASCGTITISGGTITATGGEAAAGIGSGTKSSCGDITITSGVTHVTATKGEGANSIGAGVNGSCGTVTIEDGSKVTQN